MGELLALVILILLTYFSFSVTSTGHSYSITTIVLFAAIVASAFAVLASGFMENSRVLSRSLIVFFIATILASINIMFFEGLISSVVLIITIFISLYGIFQEVFEIKTYEEVTGKSTRLKVIDNTELKAPLPSASVAAKKTSKKKVPAKKTAVKKAAEKKALKKAVKKKSAKSKAAKGKSVKKGTSAAKNKSAGTKKPAEGKAKSTSRKKK